ncbi:ACP S-malonyltransferase [Pendulispora brunnea]|uniref:Malonyl CoA-acyl carrier protein transacylase n=1 Tax=Pendulispora brunnea TaxID=2905690 RepID=A0ABZ2KG75_9BACT
MSVKTAWFFPGQGSQAVGMAKETLLASAAARDVWDRVDRALGPELRTIVMEGPEENLTLTANAQPAIVTTSLAVLAALRERFPELPLPVMAAGHSLGEYSALAASGALSVEDAARLVRARGLAMQEAVPAGVGAMAAVMALDATIVTEVCAEAEQASPAGEVVRPANFNSPGQVVIAGHAEAVKRAIDIAAGRGGKSKLLNVSAPFHSPLMEPAARALEARLAEVTISPLAFPIVTNVEARPNQDPERVKELLVKQVDGTVRWEETVRFMHEQGITRALEIGPGKALAGLSKRIAKDLKVLSVCDPASFDEIPAFLA